MPSTEADEYNNSADGVVPTAVGAIGSGWVYSNDPDPIPTCHDPVADKGVAVNVPPTPVAPESST